jgi:hypothetical protein
MPLSTTATLIPKRSRLFCTTKGVRLKIPQGLIFGMLKQAKKRLVRFGLHTIKLDFPQFLYCAYIQSIGGGVLELI